MALTGTEITILGAGVAGLALARALALRGARVTVLEQAETIREVGAGLQVSPNGAVVLRALGLSEALETLSLPAEAVELRDGRHGNLVLRMDLARRGGEAFALVHRADLINVLAEGARQAGVDIRLLQRIESVDLSGARPRLVTAQGAEMSPAILIGADGLHSKVRAALNGDAAPFFTRQVAWRATIPCKPGAPNVAQVHMGAGKHLVSYPLRGGTLRNIVAVEERIRWAEEGWNLQDDPISLRVAFESFGPTVQDWLSQVEQCWLWGLFRHPVAPVWAQILPQGAVAILGDAAHPTLPFLAQGANMALEDAYSLARMLDENGVNAATLAAYQANRAPRCAKIVAAANSNARAYHLSGPLRSIAHLGLKITSELAPDLPLKRYHWIYDYDATR